MTCPTIGARPSGSSDGYGVTEPRPSDKSDGCGVAEYRPSDTSGSHGFAESGRTRPPRTAQASPSARSGGHRSTTSFPELVTVMRVVQVWGRGAAVAFLLSAGVFGRRCGPLPDGGATPCEPRPGSPPRPLMYPIPALNTCSPAVQGGSANWRRHLRARCSISSPPNSARPPARQLTLLTWQPVMRRYGRCPPDRSREAARMSGWPWGQPRRIRRVTPRSSRTCRYSCSRYRSRRCRSVLLIGIAGWRVRRGPSS